MSGGLGCWCGGREDAGGVDSLTGIMMESCRAARSTYRCLLSGPGYLILKVEREICSSTTPNFQIHSFLKLGSVNRNRTTSPTSGRVLFLCSGGGDEQAEAFDEDLVPSLRKQAVALQLGLGAVVKLDWSFQLSVVVAA